MKEQCPPDVVLLITECLKAGATIIINDAGLPGGITVKGKPITINEIFEDIFPSNNNCQDV